MVTTCVVVWIEMFNVVLLTLVTYVTTCVVVWIEINIAIQRKVRIMSPPAWWCGLKSGSSWAD